MGDLESMGCTGSDMFSPMIIKMTWIWIFSHGLM